MDFSKAFDVVPHGSLLTKLAYYGIRGNTLEWIDSFLSNRTQRVVVDGEMSQLAPVTSGVPQGSVLGPILFLVYINDITEGITSTARLFADDTILYRPVACADDCRSLQEDVKALESWERKWGMAFNPSKCSLIHISRKKNPIVTPYILKDEILESSDTASYLGITITNNLSWNNQISKVVANGNRSLGFIKRNIKTNSTETKTRAYNTIVRPTLEYAATIWALGQSTLSSKIEMVQRRAARYACNRYSSRDSVTDMLRGLAWDSLEQRRNKARIMMLFKILYHLIAIPDYQLIPSSAKTSLPGETAE
jgi:ribonuclease P/MRP protein subunit RPP40